MCIRNFPDFPKIPAALVGMTEMENHFVALRMKIYTLPRGGQRGVHGGMVNVSTNLTKIQQLLPRQSHSRESIAINLNRRVCFKGSYKSTTCRPSQVVTQLQYLCSTELYKYLDIHLDKTWLPDYEKDLTIEIQKAIQADAEDAVSNGVEQSSVSVVGSLEEIALKPTYTLDKEDALRRSWDETCELEAKGNIQQEKTTPTMLDQLISAEKFLNQALIVAPGEGETPLSLFLDKHSEEASFVNIYCGLLRKFPKGIGYCDQARWDLANIDRRVAQSIDNIIFKMIRICVKFILSMSNVRLRKGRRLGNVFTAKELKNKFDRESPLKCDIGFTDLKNLRGSPHYTVQGKKDVYAMFWQLGTATFFVTNSMADIHWLPLLVILALVVDEKVITEEDAARMDIKTRQRLMASDPVPCARYWRHYMDSLLTAACSCDSVMGHVEDFFLRDEFQQRGLLHLHGLLSSKMHQSMARRQMRRFANLCLGI
jgi:hypothetical protein